MIFLLHYAYIFKIHTCKFLCTSSILYAMKVSPGDIWNLWNLLNPVSGYDFTELRKTVNGGNVDGMEESEDIVSGSLTICLLLLPPAYRRKLHLLLRLMHKMLNNKDINLAGAFDKKTFVSSESLCPCCVISLVQTLDIKNKNNKIKNKNK